MPTDADERKQAIARLVAAGKMTKEHPGQYPVDGYSGELPEYSAEDVRKAFPELLEIAFDEVEDEGWFAILEDGKTGDSNRVPLGDKPPANTEKLIELIHTFFRGAINQANMDETAAALAAFENMED